IVGRAARAELSDTFARLDGCGAEAELIALARSRLASDREARPRDAGVVAERTAAFRAGVQERLRQAELERAAAQARAAEERKRRRLTLALAAAVVAFVLAGGGSALWWQHDRGTRLAQTREKVGPALGQAEQLRVQARNLKGGAAAAAERLTLLQQAQTVVG